MRPDEVNLDERGQKLPGQICPSCKAYLNAATACLKEGRPRPNDLSICYQCGALLKFTELMILRELKPHEVEELPDDIRSLLLQAAAFVRKHNP